MNQVYELGEAKIHHASSIQQIKNKLFADENTNKHLNNIMRVPSNLYKKLFTDEKWLKPFPNYHTPFIAHGLNRGL